MAEEQAASQAVAVAVVDDTPPHWPRFTIGETLPWKGYEFKLVAAEGREILLRAIGPTRGLAKRIAREDKFNRRK